MKAKKLTGGPAFDAMMGKLAQVPKQKVDRAHVAWKRKRAKKKRASEGGR